MSRSYFYRDVLPVSAMVAVECSGVGLSTLFKAATLKGLSYYVFVAYSYGIATLVILPWAFIFHRRSGFPALKLSTLSKIFLLGVLGFSAQLCGYKGIEYSSPTLASAMSNLMPAFTFILAVIFRMENVSLRSSITRAKIMGTILSISGALVVVLYKGPTIIPAPSKSPSLSLHFPLGSSKTNWIIGGLLLAAEYLLASICYIVQARVMKAYPAELIVVFFINLSATIICAPVCLMADARSSSWRLRPDIALIAIIYSGFLGSTLGSVVHTWGLHVKGPVFVSIFKPLSIAIAAAMGVIFLGDALYLGSVVGAIVLSIGFYAVIWAKSKEESSEECCFPILGSSTDCKRPLLESYVQN